MKAHSHVGLPPCAPPCFSRTFCSVRAPFSHNELLRTTCARFKLSLNKVGPDGARFNVVSHATCDVCSGTCQCHIVYTVLRYDFADHGEQCRQQQTWVIKAAPNQVQGNMERLFTACRGSSPH